MNLIKSICLLSLLLFYLYVPAQDPKFPKDITVAQDGSGNYKTIQAAVNSVRDLDQWEVTIHVKKGKYEEKLIIPSWKTKINIVGEEQATTIISFNDYSGKVNPNGKDVFGNEKFSTYTSFTVLVQGDDIHFENLTIQNTAGRVGQAVALHVEGDRFIMKNCSLLGNQDTLYTAKESSRQYYMNCFIQGTTDFIFGEATALFEDCTIKSLSNSYVTAAATSPNQLFGYVFLRCKLIADTGVGKAYLGRPWRSYAKTVFIHCELGAHIVPEGWNPWKGDLMFKDKEKTAFYAEYENTGPGANPKARVNWAKQLTYSEFKKYTFKQIFRGWKINYDLRSLKTS
ncbi:MAG: pectinesterase family protein [Pedobacter sp.]|nr:pectinesterase family protein [Pedobacter sp.]MDQ8051477.1 pectinesterase family protein [Pedobacter sp.]